MQVWVNRNNDDLQVAGFGRQHDMDPIVSSNLSAIRAICQQYGVARLELFGSAARSDFDPETSDIDVIVDFLDYGLGVADRFFGFNRSLEQLLGRPVDITFARKLTNPYFLDEIENDRITLYGSEDRSAAA